MSAANSRMTLASVLAAVQTTANTATGALNAVNSAVGMANKFVTDAARKQDLRSDADFATYKTSLHQEKAQEITQMRINVEEFCKQSTRHQQLFQQAYDELAHLFKD